MVFEFLTLSYKHLRNFLVLAALIIASGFLSTCSYFESDAYIVTIAGVPDGELKDTLATSSDLIAKKNEDPDNETALLARAQADVPRLKKALASQGYYDGKVDVQVDRQVNPVLVTLTVVTGSAYSLTGIKIVAPDDSPPPLAEKLTPELTGLTLDKPAVAKPILDAQEKILKLYTTNGYPLARVDAPAAVVDSATHTMSVTYMVTAGPSAWFGETSIQGLQQVDPTYVENRLRWHPADTYDSTPVDSTRQDLVGTGLFSTVNVHPAAAVADNGSIPMIVDATERDKHSVGATAEYNTSQNILANIFWEDRNLFGNAEKLRLSAEVGDQEKNAIAAFTRPDFLDPNQSLKVTAGISDETVDPYSSRKVFGEADIERPLFEHVKGSVGVGAAHANLSTDMGGEHYTLATLPVSLKFDNSDDLLNPVSGYRASLVFTPSVGNSNVPLHFVTAEIKASAYQSVDVKNGLVSAEFVRIGSINGVSFGNLPRDLRFYSGGGGSLRGYAYQHAGPQDFDNNPIGGKSVFETGAELRIPVWKDISLVPFTEAGSYYETPIPDFNRTLLYDAGIGARYMTPVGPLRLDIAVPLKRRSNDAAIQIYASIGQAF